MTLINRVSLFFLIALAVCLAGYSTGMYLLIREHLFHQIDSQLQASLNVLVAAIEVEDDGVKWQPSDHTITLGNEREEEEVRWVIVNELGDVVDQSHNLAVPSAEDRPLLELTKMARPNSRTIRDAGNWRYLQYQLTCPHPKPVAERDPDESAEVTVTVALSSLRLHSDLWRLGWLTTLLPVSLWCIAAVTGRAYSRRALRPVEAMAQRARSMTNADFDLRLPVSARQDELTSLATAFNSLLDRLQRAYQQQQRFTGDAAHQLRTPLTILRGEIDLARRRPRSEAEHVQVLNLLSEQTTQLQQIVETLLFLARTEGNSSLPDEKTIPLPQWLPEYLEHWQSHPRFPDLQLHVEPGTGLNASDSLLRQALDNLISNAFKYSPPGSPVTIQARNAGDQLQLSVEDRGPGIPAEEREAIFEPFYRSPTARQAGISGTGLGLAIVARIAEALGGTVECQPGSPSGTRFQIALHRGRQFDPVAQITESLRT